MLDYCIHTFYCFSHIVIITTLVSHEDHFFITLFGVRDHYNSGLSRGPFFYSVWCSWSLQLWSLTRTIFYSVWCSWSLQLWSLTRTIFFTLFGVRDHYNSGLSRGPFFYSVWCSWSLQLWSLARTIFFTLFGVRDHCNSSLSRGSFVFLCLVFVIIATLVSHRGPWIEFGNLFGGFEHCNIKDF